MWLTFLIFLMSSRHVVASPPHGSSETSQDSRVRRAVPALSVSAISAPITAAGATLAMAFGGAAVAGSIVSSLVTWGALRDNEVLQAIEQVCSGKEQLCLRKLYGTDIHRCSIRSHPRHRRHPHRNPALNFHGGSDR